MTAPDPTAGEREHPTCVASGPHYFPEQCQGESVWVTSSPAVAASTGTSEDAEALARVIERAENPLDDGSPVSTYEELAAAVLASDWIAAREAAARAEERERIAQAIEALPWSRDFENVGEKCAQIAREGR